MSDDRIHQARQLLQAIEHRPEESFEFAAVEALQYLIRDGEAHVEQVRQLRELLDEAWRYLQHHRGCPGGPNCACGLETYLGKARAVLQDSGEGHRESTVAGSSGPEDREAMAPSPEL
jgi:hypothetical protein